MESEILVEVKRGGIVESVHRGHLIVVSGAGETLFALGNPQIVTFLRSSAKPFQAIPFLMSGAAERFGFSEKEIALACGSHSGERIHTETAANMLRKIELGEPDLHCGAHEPFNEQLAREMIRRDELPTQLHNNCSGKHAAMLAFAKHLGAPIETYEKSENPVQQKILEIIAEFAEIPPTAIGIGIDGCAVPNFAVSVETMAQMFAKLVFPPKSFDAELREACRRVVSAMMTFPEMIGGNVTERLDTEIMRAAHGRLISKIGAEGVYTVGVLPSPEYKKGLGIAFKIEDGEDRRARPVVALEILRQLNTLDSGKFETLKHLAKLTLKNRRGETVGEVVPRFNLTAQNN